MAGLISCWCPMANTRPGSGSSGRLELCAAYMALLLLCVIAGVDARDVQFHINNFTESRDSVKLLGDCVIDHKHTVLLPTLIDLKSVNVGRVMYTEPIQFYNATVAASFETSFVLYMHYHSTDVIAEGVAFFITPNVSMPANASGGALGLFSPDPDTGKPADGSTGIVAVELDTSSSSGTWDCAYAPHIGLNLNSLNSSVVSRPTPEIAPGSKLVVKILYNATEKHLGVKLRVHAPHLDPSPEYWVLNAHNLVLSDHVSGNSYVGIAATSGNNKQRNNIHEWQFKTWSEPPTVPKQSPPPAPAPAHRRKPSDRVVMYLGLAFLMLFAVALASACCVYWRRSGTRETDHLREIANRVLLEGVPNAGYGPRRIPYRLLKIATRDFSVPLGEGSFGGVFKGVMEGGAKVAVKRFKHQAKRGAKQFLAEVTTIGQLSHKNLVPLRGWCHEHGDFLVVYDYMANSSLDRHLYPPLRPAGRPQIVLDWEKRCNILRGVADALYYLHRGLDEPVVHRDIKPSNVMLDVNFTARLGDFGLAVTMTKDNFCQSVSGAAGTYGYIAPECVESCKVGTTSDVYSFGVTVLEVVCGRRPFDNQRPPSQYYLVNWVWNLYIDDELHSAVDPSIECDSSEATMLLQLGLMCVYPGPCCRPTSTLIIQFLAGTLALPDLPKEPPASFSQSPTTTISREYMEAMRALNLKDNSVRQCISRSFFLRKTKPDQQEEQPM